MPVKALQRYLKDTINNKTYQLTVRPHLGGWLAIVIVDDMRWEQQTEANAPVETAKEWAIKKALIDAHGSQYEQVYPLEAALSGPWTEIDLTGE
jgi:hypothetical protein